MQKTTPAILTAALVASATLIVAGCDNGKPAPVAVPQKQDNSAADKAADDAKKAEADRLAAEAKAKADKEEADRKAKEAADKAEADRLAAEAKAKADKEEAERKAKEAADKEAAAKAKQAEADRLAAEKAKADQEAAAAKAKEAAAKAEADRLAAEAKAKAEKEEAARLAKAAAEKAEKEAAERKAAEEAARRVTPAKAAKVEAPVYPESARRVRQSGQVTVTAQVNADGSVASATAEGGSAELQEAAVEAAKAWTFTPATRGGKAIKSQVVVPVNFVLGAAK